MRSGLTLVAAAADGFIYKAEQDDESVGESLQEGTGWHEGIRGLEPDVRARSA
jgi:hypothetical protein